MSRENCPPANGVFIRRPTRRDPMPRRWSTITLSIVRRCPILNRPIPAIHYMIAAAGGNSIPCAPYATFGTRELSEHVAVALKHRKATLLQHHGLIACEASLEKALWLAHEVEVLAQLYLSTLAITDPVPVLDDEAIAIVLEKFKTYGLRIEE